MSDGTRPEPRCISCGDSREELDDEGLCLACTAERGLKSVAERMRQRNHPIEPHHPQVTGQRLAAIIATAAADMNRLERALLWMECQRLFGSTLDKETHPALYAVIQSLRDTLLDEAQSANWN